MLATDPLMLIANKIKQVMYAKRNIEARLCKHFAVEKQ
jgi:hypothetical protein